MTAFLTSQLAINVSLFLIFDLQCKCNWHKKGHLQSSHQQRVKFKFWLMHVPKIKMLYIFVSNLGEIYKRNNHFRKTKAYLASWQIRTMKWWIVVRTENKFIAGITIVTHGFLFWVWNTQNKIWASEEDLNKVLSN